MKTRIQSNDDAINDVPAKSTKLQKNDLETKLKQQEIISNRLEIEQLAKLSVTPRCDSCDIKHPTVLTATTVERRIPRCQKEKEPNTSTETEQEPVLLAPEQTYYQESSARKEHHTTVDKSKKSQHHRNAPNSNPSQKPKSNPSAARKPEHKRRPVDDAATQLVRNTKKGGPMWIVKGEENYKPAVQKGKLVDDKKKKIVVVARGKDKFDPIKIYNWGEKNSGLNSRGEVQDFYRLRDEYYSRGELFEDPQFPANNSSLFYSQRPDRNYQWLRPHQICDDPKLFVEGFSRFDIQQGELGDCWLLAAAANLTMFRKLFFQVVPDDQAFGEKYAGIFHFRFWQYGRWIDVVIDDRLPTYHGKLIYLHSAEENEFWSALLEKAYAKLHGSYEALKGGSTCEAMEDFTGGVTEMYDLQNSPPDMFQIIKKAFERSSLMGCSIEPDPNVLEAETPQGLVKGHAYSITKVKYLQINTPNTSGKIPLLRLRNPWGNDTEWNGAWSDKSPEWRFIPENEKDEVGLNFDDDGEFWMSYKDFSKYFDRIEICNLSPDSMGDDSSGKKWELSYFEGEWVSGVTAGGCRNFLDTFWSNPQYRITLTTVDEDSNDNKCTVIIALMQKNRRQQRKMGLDVLTIGFAIYYLPNPNSVPKPLDRNFFKFNASVGRSPSFINLREVTCRFRLPPGTYCIVPSTFDPNEEGEFLIRVFSENKNYMEEHDEEIGFGKTTKSNLQSAIKAPPPAAEEKDAMLPLFNKLAGDNEELSWSSFQELLRTTFKTDKSNKAFSNDVCRSLVALADTNFSGKLGYEEFVELWSDIRQWKSIFMRYDVDNSNNLSGFELREALRSAGYSLNNHTLNILMHRYGNGKGSMEFDEYIMCIVKLKRMIEAFKERDPNDKGEAKFTMGDFIDTTLYS